VKQRASEKARLRRASAFQVRRVYRLGVLTASLAIAAISASPSVRAQVFTWNGGGTTNNFNDAANWAGGVPTSSNSTSLVFAGTTRLSPVHNLGTFSLNSLVFAPGAGAFTISTTASGGGFTFGGTTPRITQNSHSTQVIGTSTTVATSVIPLVLNSPLTIDGSGFGNLTINGPLSGNNGITINQTGTLYGARGSVVALTGNTSGTSANVNTFVGNTTLNNGNLSLGMASALGDAANTLIINSGENSVRFTNVVTVANNVTLNSNLNFAGTTSGTLSGVLSGAGGLNLVTGGLPTLTLTGANTYTGATTIGAVANLASFSTSGPTLTLSGNGTIAGTSAITINQNATLQLTNVAATNLADRIPSVPINSNGGRITYTGVSGTTASSETFGNINATGMTTLSVTNNNNTLNFGTINRTDNATFYVRGAGIGGPASATANAINFTGLTGVIDPLAATPGTGVYQAVVPYMTGNTSATSTFPRSLVFVNANGLRVTAETTAADYNQVGSGGSLLANANNNLTANPAALSGTVRINALTASGGGTVSGTGTLQIYSGVVGNFLNFTFNGPTIDFNANPGGTGYFHLGDDININGTSNIVGTGGVVVSGFSTSLYALVMNNTANSFTGGLTLNGLGVVEFTSDAQLGAAGGAITFGGGSLIHTAGTSITLDASRPVKVNASGGTLNASNTGGTLTVPNVITGDGSLFKAGGGTVVLSGANTYTGDTIVSAGTLRITGTNSGSGATQVNGGTLQFNNVGSLSSGTILLNGGAIEPLTTTTINRPLQVAGSSTFTTGTGLTVTQSSPISGFNTLTKAGAGDLILTADNPFSGAFTLNAGTATLSGANGAFNKLTGTTTIGSGARLTLDNTAGTADRLPNTVPVAVNNGELRILGRDNTTTTETIGALTASGASSVVRLTPGASASLVLNLESYTVPTGSNTLTFVGTNLGVDTGANPQFTRIFISNLTTATALANTFVDNGTIVASAVYDPVFGIRAAAIYNATPSNPIQNSAPTNTPVDADVVATGAVVTENASENNTIASLRLNDNSSVAVKPGTTLTLVNGKLGFNAGGNQTVLGGTVQVNGAVFQLDAANTTPATVSSTIIGLGGLSKTGTGTVNLTGTNNIIGDLNVAGGTLGLDNGVTNTFTALSGAGSIAMGSGVNLVITGGTGAFGGIISGTGSFTQSGTANITFNGANTFTGATNINGGTMTLTGASGALTGTSGINIRPNATLALDNSTAANTNRIGNTTPLNIVSGGISLTGNTNTTTPAAVNEVASTLNATGFNVLTVGTTANAGGTALTFGGLNRTSATFLARGNSLGTGAPGTNGIGNVLFTNSPAADLVGGGGAAGTTTISILPYVVGNSATTTAISPLSVHFVTYDPVNGLRPLVAATEYVTGGAAQYATATADTNFRQNAGVTLPAGLTQVNSLINDTFGLSGSTGGSTLRISSGALMFTDRFGVTFDSATTSLLTIDFNGKTANIFGMNADPTISNTITMNAALTNIGSGGLVFSAVYGSSLNLTNPANAINGITVNGSNLNGNTNLPQLQFGVDAALGTPTGAITLNNAVFAYSGTAPASTARNVVIGGQGGFGVTNAAGVLTYTGTVSGEGDLLKTGAGTLLLAGTTNVPGNMDIRAGTLQFNSPAALPSGSILLAGTLQPLGNQTLNKAINVTGAGGVNIAAGEETTFNGIVSGAAGLTKSGIGTATFTAVNTKTSTITVSDGVLRLTGAGTFLNASGVTITGGQFLLDNSGGAADRLGATTGVTVNGGDFRINGANAATTEAFGALTIGTNGGFVTLNNGTASSLVVTAASFTAGGPVVFRGNNLGTVGGTQLFLTGLAQGLIAGGLYDSSVTGTGASLAFYDTTLGVRGLLDSDYLQTGTIQNDDNPSSNAFNTPKNANVLIGNTFTNTNTGGPNGNTIASLWLRNNGVLTIGNATPTLTLTSGAIRTDSTTNAQITGGTLASGTAAINVIGDGNLTIDSVLTGSGGLSKGGTGTLTLNGANTYTGTTRLNAGTLNIGNATAVPATSALTLALNSVLNIGNFTLTLASLGGNAGTVNVAGGAQVTVTGAANIGSLNLGNNSLFSIASGSIANTTTLGTGSTLRLRGGATFGGVISGAGGMDFPVTTATTLTLNGNNTFTGGITGGVGARYALGNPNGFGTGPLTLTTTTDATLINFNFANGTVPNAIALPTNTVAVGYNTTFSIGGTGPSTVTLSGALTGGNSGQTTLIFNGPANDSGTFVLTNPNNSYEVNRIIVTNGVLAFTTVNALGSGAFNPISVNAGAGLRFDANNLDLNRNIRLIGASAGGAASTIDTQGFNATFSGGIFDEVDAGNQPLANAPNAVWTKKGTGTLTFSADSSFFSGSTRVDEGTLRIANTYTKNITVNAGGTLDGTGTAGAVTLNGGTLGAGDGTGVGVPGVGLLQGTSLLWQSGLLAFDLSDPNSSAASDRLDLSGFFNKGTSPGPFVFSFFNSGSAVNGTTYRLVNFQGGSTNFTASDFAAQGANGSFIFNAANGQLDFNLISFTGFGAVPEPGSMALLLPGAGAFALAIVRRRKGSRKK
jgi:fibronectin-binding autotransporter adhesin